MVIILLIGEIEPFYFAPLTHWSLHYVFKNNIQLYFVTEILCVYSKVVQVPEGVTDFQILLHDDVMLPVIWDTLTLEWHHCNVETEWCIYVSLN